MYKSVFFAKFYQDLVSFYTGIVSTRVQVVSSLNYINICGEQILQKVNNTKNIINTSAEKKKIIYIKPGKFGFHKFFFSIFALTAQPTYIYKVNKCVSILNIYNKRYISSWLGVRAHSQCLMRIFLVIFYFK